MSWLYTIVFAGVVFSAGESVSVPELRLEADVPAVEERVVQDETERFEHTYPLNANGRVSLSNVNGSIVVEAWDRNEVRLQYVKSAESRERLAEVEIRIDARPDRFHVEADHNSPRRNNGWSSGRLKVEFHLMVPRGAVLNEIEAVNGSVTVSNFTNITRISAVNGTVRATNLRGTANLSTVNGEVHADFDRLDAGSRVSLDTVNGRVNLLLPSDVNATIKADSLNGNITNDLGLPVQKGRYVGRDVYGRIGSGEVQIKMDSVNGTIHFSRKNDGRSPNPVVNLLPQKGKDEDNWNWNNPDLHSSNVKRDKDLDTAKLNKEIDKAVKESQKLSAKAAKDGATAIAKIQPPIAEITAESIAQTVENITKAAELLDARELQKQIQKAQADQNSLLGRVTQVGFFPAMPRVETKSGTFVVKGTPKVTVQARGCSVKVRGWDRSEVRYRVVQFGDQRDPGPIKFTESHTDSSVDIAVENPRLNTRLPLDTSNFRIEISVPRRSNMKITADGELRVEGVTGEIELNGFDEPINVRDAGGRLKVMNSDGLIRVVGFNGDVEAQTSDGMISLEGDFKTLRARGTDGSVSLTLPDGVAADVESNNPDIATEGVELRKVSSTDARTRYKIGAGGRPYSIETDGPINIRSSSTLIAK